MPEEPTVTTTEGPGTLLSRLRARLAGARTARHVGRVTEVIGLVIESLGPPARIGEICTVYPGGPDAGVPAEVVGFRSERLLLMPFGRTQEIRAGSEVVATDSTLMVPAGRGLLGRILDGLGNPADGRGPLAADAWVPTEASPPPPTQRPKITEPLPLGIKALDGVLTCGRGQRLGIFAGAGVGKSTLMGMVARHTEADVNVIALVGERGRELGDFIDEALGPQGLARSVVVSATSDEPPLVRIKAAQVGTAIAEYFRAQGLDVLLMMDSITRYAQAMREVGLTIGEPPARMGYPPSVFANLPRLLERSGTSPTGSITGLYTVLVEGDDLADPVADSTRAILDGHIVLSRALAQKGHFPAVDVLQSVSRLMPNVVNAEQVALARDLRSALADYGEAEDLISLGAYVPGSNPRTDRAIALREGILEFLQQGIDERVSFEVTVQRLHAATSGRAVAGQVGGLPYAAPPSAPTPTPPGALRAYR